MTMKQTKTVPFDPGFSNHNPTLPDDIFTQLDLISKIKLANQRKFKLQIIENALTKTNKNTWLYLLWLRNVWKHNRKQIQKPWSPYRRQPNN